MINTMFHIKAVYIFFIPHAIQTIAADHKEPSTRTIVIFSRQGNSSQSNIQPQPNTILASAVCDTTYEPGAPTMRITQLHIKFSPRKPLIEKLMRNLFDEALKLAQKEQAPVTVLWSVDPVLGKGAPLPAEEEAWHEAAMTAWRSENLDRAIIIPAMLGKYNTGMLFDGTVYKAQITAKTTNETDAKRSRTE